ncbi:MAG: hypothetical protein HY720_28415 [Planctomycetes bacterium]|nr:hypothetical protein [Planctomycetota bacterium]
MTPVTIHDAALPPDLEDRVRRAAEPVVAKFLDVWLPAPARTAGARFLLGRIRDNWGRFHASLPRWRQALDCRGPDRVRVILLNTRLSPEKAGLHEVRLERSLPVVAFQHGVNREPNAPIRMIQVYFENNTADIFLAFSERGAAASDENHFARGPSIAVGIPIASWP